MTAGRSKHLPFPLYKLWESVYNDCEQNIAAKGSWRNPAEIGHILAQDPET